MQFAHPPIHLPSEEYARLQRLMLTMIGDRSALAAILRRKLGSAQSIPAQRAARDVALSGVYIRFRIDAQRLQQRILTWQPPRRDDKVHLSLLSPRGLALLGLTPGQLVSYRTETGRTEFLRLEQILSQQSRRPSKNEEAPRPPGEIHRTSNQCATQAGGAAGGWGG
jgi:hypothetical protein